MKLADFEDNVAYEKKALNILCGSFMPEYLAILPFTSFFPATIDGDRYVISHNKFDKTESHESPDWQSEELNLGVEVTIAISQKEGCGFGTWKKINEGAKEFGDVGNKLAEMDKKHRFGGKLVEPATPIFTSGVDFHHGGEVETVKDVITKKIKKIRENKDYKKFKFNWLFVFSMRLFTKESLQEMFSQIEHEDSFNVYFIYSIPNDELLVFNPRLNNALQIYPVVGLDD